MSKLIKGLFLSVAVFMLAGCATSRGYLDLTIPQETITKQNGMQVYIRSIQDNREFQIRPSSPDIPSFGSKKDQADQTIKSRTIARKRNGYGKAMGNIFLEENQSVQTVIYDAVKNSLNSLGFDVTNDKNSAKSDAIVMDISIDKFWSWMNIGVWTLRVDTIIKTSISVVTPAKTFITETYAKNPCQVGSAANWKKAMRMAINSYISEIKDKLSCLPNGC
jgi:uncharacterized lipoprotein YajG